MGHPTAVEISSPKSRKTALVLCGLGGWCGLHRLYIGDGKNFMAYAVTFGGFGLLWLADFLKILTGNFHDKNGFRLLNW